MSFDRDAFVSTITKCDRREETDYSQSRERGHPSLLNQHNSYTLYLAVRATEERVRGCDIC